jgi:hypothetical protein
MGLRDIIGPFINNHADFIIEGIFASGDIEVKTRVTYHSGTDCQPTTVAPGQI